MGYSNWLACAHSFSPCTTSPAEIWKDMELTYALHLADQSKSFAIRCFVRTSPPDLGLPQPRSLRKVSRDNGWRVYAGPWAAALIDHCFQLPTAVCDMLIVPRVLGLLPHYWTRVCTWTTPQYARCQLFLSKSIPHQGPEDVGLRPSAIVIQQGS